MTVEFQGEFLTGTSVGPVANERSTLRRPPLGAWSKRLLDLVVVMLFLPILAPIFLGLALMIRSGGPGPVFYGHVRVGHRGRLFRCWKFRTMVTDADAVLDAHLAANPAAREMWIHERKLTNDPRITPLGATLRKLSLDELPQLFNVLRGDMSLVGPRPVVTEELQLYGASARFYLRARPGLTGLWQVSGRSDTTYRQRVTMDRAYVTGWSLWRDLKVLAMTIPVVLMSRGAR